MIFRRGNVPSVLSSREPLRPFDMDLVRFLDTLSSNLAALFDKGIGISDNMDIQILTYTSNAAPDTEDSVAHTLKRVPEGFIVIGLDKAGILYQSSAYTTAALKIKCNVASVTAKLIVF